MTTEINGWANLYWDLTALEVANFLPGTNVVFLGKVMKSEQEARDCAILQDCKQLRYIATVPVPADVEIPVWP
jgi:hypothetical protein